MELSIEDRKFSFINEEGNQIAEMTYSLAGETLIIIDHTEVHETYRGNQLGYQLLLQVVEMAKNTGKKIIPLCPYAKSVFDKTDEFDSVLFRTN